MNAEVVTGIACSAIVAGALIGARWMKHAGEEEWLRYRVERDPFLRIGGVFVEVTANMKNLRQAANDAAKIMRNLGEKMKESGW